MGLAIVTPAASDPVTTAEAKSHLRVEVSDDDTLISNLISAATELAQTITGRQFINATFDYTLDGFPSGDQIILPRSPLSSVSSITYTDADGNTGQVFSSSSYTADTYHTPGRVALKYGASWPSHRREANGVVIRFVAGYGANTTDVPEAARQAILLMVGHWYEHREAASELSLREVPMAARSLLDTVALREVC